MAGRYGCHWLRPSFHPASVWSPTASAWAGWFWCIRSRRRANNLAMQKITPFLWFDDQAEEAVRFYLSIFKKSKVLKVARYTKEAANQTGRPPGSVLTIEFELEGQRFVALNGGPHIKFTEAVSFVVNCKTQEELDKFWKKLSAGGK